MNKFYIPINWETCSKEEQKKLLQRPAVNETSLINSKVKEILKEVKKNGDIALHNLTFRLDKIRIKNLKINKEQIKSSQKKINKTLKNAILTAIKNIRTFHSAQKITELDLKIQPGIRCQQLIRPLESVGLYIPGGIAPLFSTVLMLAIPAQIAKCRNIILCSPPPIADEILYCADLCKIKKIFQIGGAQAIAALSFGTESIPKVDKIFGPGNIYVTEAKRQISQELNGTAIDLPAGPSEILIIADEEAKSEFIAADLLSQTEHGSDSQAILLTPSIKLAQNVSKNLKIQLKKISRRFTSFNALKNSHLIVTKNLKQCIDISNQYAPEHLIIQTYKPRNLLNKIKNAGSIFLGEWSPESMGDYASGTNHVLPTYGYSTTHSGLSIIDFQKRMTVQEITKKGFNLLSETVEILASAENLEAHKNAVTLRMKTLKKIENE